MGQGIFVKLYTKLLVQSVPPIQHAVVGDAIVALVNLGQIDVFVVSVEIGAS